MLYDLTVPAYQNGLKALSGELSKASAWGADNGIGELQFAVARLAPDMFPLASQVRFTCIQALQPLHRLGGIAVHEFPEAATDFAGLKEQNDANLDNPHRVAGTQPGADDHTSEGATMRTQDIH